MSALIFVLRHVDRISVSAGGRGIPLEDLHVGVVEPHLNVGVLVRRRLNDVVFRRVSRCV